MEKWGARAPRDALAWLAGQPGDVRALGELREDLLRAWGASDVAAATAYAQTLESGPARNEALAHFATGMLGTDPGQAVKASREIPLDALLTGNGFFKTWARDDAPAAGRALAERMQQEGKLQALPGEAGSAAEHVFDGWARKDPQGAAAFAITQEGVLRDRILPEAVRVLSRQNHSAALAWVQGLPAGTGRSIAYEVAAAEWAALSTNEVAAWLPSVPRGADYAAAVTGFAGRAFAADPSSALEWLRTIPDAAARERALKAAWEYWSERHTYAPTEWLKTSPDLTAHERAVLIEAERR